MDDRLTAALTERLRGEVSGDPLTALLLEQMASMSGPAEPDETELLKSRLGRAQHAIDRLRADLVAANTMAEWVAGALGACPACWGLDRFCRRCSGTGAPGSSPPDLDQLVPWIEPALRRAGLAITSAGTDVRPAPNITEGAHNGRG